MPLTIFDPVTDAVLGVLCGMVFYILSTNPGTYR